MDSTTKGIVNEQAISFNVEEEDDQSNLCCCEYFSFDHKRSHILTCCCNCSDLDEVFTNLVTCRDTDIEAKNAMLITFQDRLRIPWQGGAKQVSFDALAPIFVIPLVLGLSAIHSYLALIFLTITSIALLYGLNIVKKKQIRTRFFCMWMLCSVIYSTIIFEVAVPLLELLPEENLVLVLLSCASIYCFYRVRHIAPLNHVSRSKPNKENLNSTRMDGESREEKKSPTADTCDDDSSDQQQTALLIDNNDDDVERNNTHEAGHCSICAANIIKYDHHSFWLDCCIAELNFRLYVFGLLFADLALLLGANLTLTAVCHPVLIFRFMGIFVMLPDDCSEVFESYELGISFVIGVYALLMAIYISIILIRQIYFISIGLTMYEYQRGHRTGHRRKSILTNWRLFLCSWK